MPAPNDPELDALLGAYALDALDPDERGRVDEYLALNARARDEVDELRESAAALALAPVDDATAPAGLWDRISHAIDDDLDAEADADANGGADELAARRASRATTWMPWAIAAAVFVAALLATQVVSLNHRLDNTPGTGESAAVTAFAHALRADGAKKVSLAAAGPDGGNEVARVVLLPDGSGYMKNDGLAPLDADHTYQLWAITGTADDPVVISAGVLGSNPKAAAFRTSTDVNGFAITVEQMPGVGQSTQPPIATAAVA